ncbi:MAG: nucleoside:proton symporter [Rhodospirillaceae bacterium]|nr:nucleoside:proton symporter [Rhodospirillaceae bacterium]
MTLLQSLLGIAGLVGLAWLVSERKRGVAWRPVGVGLALQLLLAVILIKVPVLQSFFAVLNRAVTALSEATLAGTSLLFGYVGGAPPPWATTGTGSNFILAFQSFPLILVISALSALFFHWNIIQPIVRAFAWVLRRTIGIDGPAGVAAVMDIFVGMVEAPLVVKPYLRAESRTGLFVIMTAGMATVAGTVMVLYATMLTGIIPNPLGQILTASILATPAAIVIAYIMVPEDPAAPKVSADSAEIMLARQPGDNMMSVITRGTIEGAQLIINVIAMMIVLVALVSLVNQTIGLLPNMAGTPLTLQRIFGWLMSPLAWMTGIPWSEAPAAGALLGTKTALNELIAYSDLSQLPPDALSPRSRLIMSYALAGFANFGSLGIMIGGLSAMVPERRSEIVQLAPKALISGTLATCMSGAMVGLLTWG